jgi:hypothetical protein
METTHKQFHLNEVWYRKCLWTYLEAVFESLFWSIKLLNMVIMRNFDVILGRTGGRSSSVSIVSGYRLDVRATNVRSSAEARDFSSNLCVQTGSEAHLVTSPTGTWGPFSGSKARPRRNAGHSPHLAPRS